MSKKVLLVGHCGPDTSRIERVLAGLGATFEGTWNLDGAMEKLAGGDFALVIPNRVIAGDEEGGLKVIRAIKENTATADTPVMLVSGIASAQTAAEEAGALPGFGKDELESGGAAQKIAPVLEA